MKFYRLFLLAAIVAVVVSSCNTDQNEGCTDPDAINYDADAEVDNGSCIYDTAAVVTVSGEITTNTEWTADKAYFLQGFVYVKAPAILTIQAGTVIKGDKPSKGSLIIERGAKIMAVGTAQNPIVFTSAQPVGQRSYGDWGGLIICGNAPINLPGGNGIVEGGTNANFGGTDPEDNSGMLQYVRIEFPGIAFQPNQEINGLTMAGVGRQTTIDHVQVSYSGDDAFEWFGGTVNCTHLVAHRTWDDDFDTDNGFAGAVQFALGIKDPNVADASGSNGFESDNDAGGTGNQPNTTGVFSNVSLFGPLATPQTQANFQFESGLHLRSNTRLRVFNSVIAGYPEGVYVKGSFAQTNAENNELVVKNSVIAGCELDLQTDLFSPFDADAWFNAPSSSNTIYADNTDLQVSDPFNLTAPNCLPNGGSPLLSGSDFSDPFLNPSSFTFQNVPFRGAMGTTDWTQDWTNFDPENTVY